ncbi:MAG: glycosyltransferase family 2 protein [Pseudomonadota bacterium]|nr:glycosyltransferase family 2 protein [Pseudomonadota bacterium]
MTGTHNTWAIVVTYRPVPQDTARLLHAIAPQCAQVLVVDNGSPPAVQAALAAACAPLANVRWLPLTRNLGLGAAQNRGIAQARAHHASHVLLLDQDSLPAPDMLARLHTALHALQAQGAPVGGVGAVAHLGPEQPPLLYVSQPWGPRRARPQDLAQDLVPAAFLVASGSLLPMQALQQVGPLREEWFIDHLDLEWSLRARQLGLGLWCVPGASLAHHLGERQVRLPGRARPVHVHSPVRNYYLTRNTLLLMRTALMPWRWRLGYAAWLVQYVAFNACLASPRLPRWRQLLLGLRDGLLGRTGPAPS